MARTLIFDTETTGFANGAGSQSQPGLVQIAAILFDMDRPVSHLSAYMQPIDHHGQNIPIPTEDFFVRAGITQAAVDKYGMDRKHTLLQFAYMVKKAHRLVAHNITFDWPVILAAFKREQLTEQLERDKPLYCTMRTLTDTMRLPKKKGTGYKWPRLDEAYRTYIDPLGFEGAHDAMVDVTATSKVLFHIETKLKLPLWEFV